MSAGSWHRVEAEALAETFRSLGPQAPTLCDGWEARHLLAHLVLRDQQPWEMAADMLSRAEPGSEHFLGRLADVHADPARFETLVDRFLDGPGRFSPMRWGGERVELLEYVIHHEDLRRGGGDLTPRERPEGLIETLWRNVRFVAGLGFRRSESGVVLVRPDGVRAVVRRGRRGVALRGDVVDLALYASGRPRGSRLEILGEDDARAAFIDRYGRPRTG